MKAECFVVMPGEGMKMVCRHCGGVLQSTTGVPLGQVGAMVALFTSIHPHCEAKWEEQQKAGGK